MALAAPTQLATVNSNTAAQTTWATGSIVFPTSGQDVLGLLLIALPGLASNAAVSVADNAAHTWTVVAVEDNNLGSGAHTAVAFFKYPSGGSNTTVTVTATFTSTNERFGWCGYTTSHDTTTPNDATGVAGGAATATSVTATTSTNLAVDSELGVVSMCVSSGNDTGPSTWPSSGWTSLLNPVDSVRHRIGGFEYQLVSGGSGATLSSGSIPWTTGAAPAASIATFKPAAGGAPAMIPEVSFGLSVT